MNRRIMTLMLVLLVPPAARAQESVVDTIHNLARTGPGAVKSLSSDDACGFCHVPHSAQPRIPLWGHRLSDAEYRVYGSDTMDAWVPQPSGSSRLCLGCHDGTIALGETVKGMAGPGPLPATSPGRLGTNLSGTHPVSIRVDGGLVLKNNARQVSLNAVSAMLNDPDGVQLDADRRVQCTSCHDPHSDANYARSSIHFYRKPTFSEVCLVCHTP